MSMLCKWDTDDGQKVTAVIVVDTWANRGDTVQSIDTWKMVSTLYSIYCIFLYGIFMILVIGFLTANAGHEIIHAWTIIYN